MPKQTSNTVSDCSDIFHTLSQRLSPIISQTRMRSNLAIVYLDLVLFAHFRPRHPTTLNYKNNWISTTSCCLEICTRRVTHRLVSSMVMQKNVVLNSHNCWWRRVTWIWRQV